MSDGTSDKIVTYQDRKAAPRENGIDRGIGANGENVMEPEEDLVIPMDSVRGNDKESLEEKIKRARDGEYEYKRNSARMYLKKQENFCRATRHFLIS